MGWLRHPKTTQERRHAPKRGFLEIEGYRIKVRGKRSFRNLPEAWDDILNMSWKHRSWKRHRLNQWKEK